MFKNKICYDPAVNDPAGGTPAAEVKFSSENPPKTKEDWQKLAQDDPKTWMDLTQTNTDRMFRENKELQEKLSREQQEKENLTVELNRHKAVQPTNPDPNNKQPYGTNNFPKTKEEWDALALEDPTFAIDLRLAFNNKQTTISTDFNRARTDYAKEVQDEHPDMYLTELDSTGAPVKDDKGNVVFKRDQNGLVIPDKNSQKWKVWEQIYNESSRPDGTNPLDAAPNAPRLMRAELERRLIQKGQTVIAQTKQNHVAGPGVTPPVSIKVSFKSKEEEGHAEKAIQRGVYTSKEQYCQLRDGGSSGIYDQNVRPDFSKK